MLHWEGWCHMCGCGGAAKFVDKQLKSSKGSSESEIEDLLDRVLMLCECWPRWFRLSGW